MTEAVTTDLKNGERKKLLLFTERINPITFICFELTFPL